MADIPTAAGTASPKTEAPAVGVVKADGDSSGKAEGTAVGSGAVNTPVAVSHSNAYMLVYRRRDSVYSPTSQVEAGSVPPSALVSPSLLPEVLPPLLLCLAPL